MAKSNSTLTTSLIKKKDKLDWMSFNLIENLLVFCVMKERSVPKESGVHFRITVEVGKAAVCILFQIDRRSDPLIKGSGPRPDYMVLYAEKGTCICTIIEMKGTQEKNLEHGIDQIKNLRDGLREEFKKHICTKLKVKFQGILLTPFNSQVPAMKLAKEAAAGLVILPLQYHHKAELYGYISKENNIRERYKHEERTREIGRDEFNFIEDVITNKALDIRIKDTFYNDQFTAEAGREGIYINHVLPDERSYSALAVDNTKFLIAVKETGNEYKDKLIEELNKLGLKNTRDYRIVEIT